MLASAGGFEHSLGVATVALAPAIEVITGRTLKQAPFHNICAEAVFQGEQVVPTSKSVSRLG
jgi:hypothetical protein